MRGLFPLLLSGCLIEAGQPVRARIIDQRLDCTDATPSIATLTLDDVGDFVVAEVVDRESGTTVSVPYTRDGVEITWTCLAGMQTLPVKVLAITNEAITPADEDPGPPPS
jgi:hypothetical protein